MTYINKKGFVERNTRTGKNPNSKGTTRDWFLIKTGGGTNNAKIQIGNVYFPSKYFGKKVKLKMIIIKEKEIFHYVILKSDQFTKKYPVYLCNQTIRLKQGKTIINSKSMIYKVTCKNCLKMLNKKWKRKEK